jgi:TonB-linked SusC/RagA family outer membrane protein
MHLTAIVRSLSYGHGLTRQIVRVMKLTAILLLSACLTVSAAGFGQRVSLNEKDAKLEKVFQEIKKQTGYVFFYNYNLLQNAKAVTVNVKDAKLEEVLGLCFLDQPLSFVIENKTVVVTEKSKTVNEQLPIGQLPLPIDISGRVVDSTGTPLQGASVRVRGTRQGTTTDFNGYYTLKGIDENAIIEISYQGYELFSVKASSTSALGQVTLKMKPNELDVVTLEANTGYQKLKPNEINGSMVVIDNKTLNKQVGTNIIDRLKGVTNGMLFMDNKSDAKGGDNPYSIRGLGTINGNVAPLIVMDNFIYEGNINNINPNDVESITILKDAAATSIYGARGGNGVIVLTTKKGRYKQKFTTELNSTVIVSESPDLYYYPKMSSSDYIDVEQLLFNKGFFDNTINAAPYYKALTPGVTLFLKKRAGLISPGDFDKAIDQLKSVDSRNDYNKYFYSNAVTQQYSLNLRGGSENIAWLIAGSYDKSISNLSAKGDKINLRINNSYKPTKKIEINVSTYYTNSKNVSGKPTPEFITVRNAPYQTYADVFGNPLPVDTWYRSSYTDTAGAGRLLNWKYYPLDDYKHDIKTDNREELVGAVAIQYRIIKDLQLNLDFQYQRQWGTTERYADIESITARDLINRFTVLSSSSATPPVYNAPKGGILDLANYSITSINYRPQANYNKKWKRHMVSSIAGFEIKESVLDAGARAVFYGYKKDPLTQTIINSNITYPEYTSGTYRNIGDVNPKLGNTTTQRYVSEFFNASYSYNEKYSVSGSFRKDASNLFGLSTNDKWNPFWSGGIGWDVSKEHFYRVPFIPTMRIKASVGISGNVDPTKSALPIISYGIYSNDVNTGYQAGFIGAPNNPNLRWEKLKHINIGIEFSSKQDIVSGSLEFYTKKGTDLYATTPYDYSNYGYSSTVSKNVADMKGRGIDLQLKSKNIDRTFKWNTNFIFNYNTSITTRYFTDESQLGNRIFYPNYTNLINPVVGKPLYAIAAFKWGGLNDKGYPQGYVDGQLTTDYNKLNTASVKNGIYSNSIVFKGSSIPIIFGSVGNSFEWKGFIATVNFVYKLGYYFWKPVFSANSLINSGVGRADYAKRWQKPGDELITNIPQFMYPYVPPVGQTTTLINQESFYSASEINVLKGDQVRLQFIDIRYNLKRNRLVPFKELGIYANLSNLGIMWRANKEHFDPDSPASPPAPKRYSIGLTISL